MNEIKNFIILTVFAGVFILSVQMIHAMPYDLSQLLPFDPAEQVKFGKSINIDSFPAKVTFRQNNRELHYLAVSHTTDQDSRTCRMIRDEIERLRPSFLILEGFGSSKAEIDKVKECCLKLDEYPDEPYYAAYLAQRYNIPFIGGEPDDQDIIKLLEEKGYTKDDVAYFYFTQQIPQKWRHKKFEESDLPQIFEQLTQSWKGLFGKTYTYAEYQEWLTLAHGKVVSFRDLINTKMTAPLGMGNKVQKISYEIETIRDSMILHRILDATKIYDVVTVIYGGSHYCCQRKVLQQYLGNPSYQAF